MKEVLEAITKKKAEDRYERVIEGEKGHRELEESIDPRVTCRGIEGKEALRHTLILRYELEARDHAPLRLFSNTKDYDKKHYRHRVKQVMDEYKSLASISSTSSSSPF